MSPNSRSWEIHGTVWLSDWHFKCWMSENFTFHRESVTVRDELGRAFTGLFKNLKCICRSHLTVCKWSSAPPDDVSTNRNECWCAVGGASEKSSSIQTDSLLRLNHSSCSTSLQISAVCPRSGLNWIKPSSPAVTPLTHTFSSLSLYIRTVF